ncbi:MAG: hypothetical protein HYZ74_07750, partial [Elusimicrobia bacterium]|nr:hypothetical protein [Elusimicrobiota bacterium]
MSPTIHGLLVLALASFPASLLAQTLEGQSQQAREALGAASGALNGLAAKAQAAGASGKVVGTTPVSKPGDYWETGTILGRPVK